MSKFTYNLIPAARRGDVAGLKSVISKLEDHLKCANEKLGEFRKLIRTESNIKSRNIYLKKVCNMVKEQHTIKSILENYKKKLRDLESRKQLKLEIKPTPPQQTKNEKLFELFQNYEPIEQKDVNIPSSPCQTSIGKKRKLKDDGEEKTEESPINDESNKCLKTQVNEEKQKEKVPESLDEEILQNRDADIPMVEDSKQSSNDSQLRTQTEQKVEEDKKTEGDEWIEVKVEEEEYEISSGDNATENPFTINNHGEAMQYLKALMEYALLNENFRAIGLLMQTEDVFIKPPEVSDFEV